MRVVFDTTGVVNVDRQREPTVSLLEQIVDQGADLYVSTVTVAEILAGAKLTNDPQEASMAAKRVLGQFNWIDLDGGVADELGHLLAHIHQEGKPIEFQDVAIAASHRTVGADRLVTSNEDHFNRLPGIEEDVRSPKALLAELE